MTPRAERILKAAEFICFVCFLALCLGTVIAVGYGMPVKLTLVTLALALVYGGLALTLATLEHTEEIHTGGNSSYTLHTNEGNDRSNP
jgi:hypothetical protein